MSIICVYDSNENAGSKAEGTESTDRPPEVDVHLVNPSQRLQSCRDCIVAGN